MRGKTPQLILFPFDRLPHNLRIMSRVNGETRQDSNTRNMIFGVYYLVSFISMVMTLEPDASEILPLPLR
ncbi:MAG: fumarylacetoacetate hydrolase family protein [Nitrososphaerota archaeon]